MADEASVVGRVQDTDGSKTLGALWLDYDRDGDEDLYVANDMAPNHLYENQGDGTFTDVADAAGVADRRASMGVTAGDYDADGYPDLYFTHYANQNNGFYHNNGDGTFEDRSGEDDLSEDLAYVGWGTRFTDWDRDGDLDLVAVNGHTEWKVTGTGDDPGYDQATLVFRQDQDDSGEAGEAEWIDVSGSSGTGITQAQVTRGAAFADHDLDGDTDVLLVNNANQSLQLIDGSDVAAHTLIVELDQPGGNPNAIGARVTVEAGDIEQHQVVRAGASFLSQNSLKLNFGLAEHTTAERVTVEWPDGATTQVSDVAADQAIRVHRSTGDYVVDTLSPLTQGVFDGPGGPMWFSGAVNVTLDATDRSVSTASGVASTEYRLPDGDWQAYTGEVFTFETEGLHTLYGKSTDEIGNAEPPRRIQVGIDETPPSASHSLDGIEGEGDWWIEAELTLTGHDDLSGIELLEYRLDGGAWQVYEEPLRLPDGVYTVDYRAIDRAGNPSPVGSFDVQVDGGVPSTEITNPQSGSALVGGQQVAAAGAGPVVAVGEASIEIEVSATDVTSGVDKVVFVVDGHVEAVDHQAPWAWTWDLGGVDDGLHEIQVVALDESGNPGVAEREVIVVGNASETTADAQRAKLAPERRFELWPSIRG